MCASSSGPDCLQFLTDPDAASAQEAVSSCDGYYWPTRPLLRGVRQLRMLSLRSLSVLAMGRATDFHFWAARRQAPAHGLAVCSATCSRFLQFVGKLWHIFGVLSFSKVSFLSLFENKQKSTKTWRFYFFKIILHGKPLLGMFAYRCVHLLCSNISRYFRQSDYGINSSLDGREEMLWGA